MAAEQQTHNYYMNIGPIFADPVARQLYAEIASVEEQHVTQYETIIDPTESWLGKWVLHEANEVYNQESAESLDYRSQVNSARSPSQAVSAGAPSICSPSLREQELLRAPIRRARTFGTGPRSTSTSWSMTLARLSRERAPQAPGRKIVSPRSRGADSLEWRTPLATGSASSSFSAEVMTRSPLDSIR